MHHTKNVLEARMFGRGKNPPRGLQLMNLPQSLEPRMIDDLPLGNLAGRETFVRHQWHVTVQRVVTQGFAAKVWHRTEESRAGSSWRILFPISKRPAC